MFVYVCRYKPACQTDEEDLDDVSPHKTAHSQTHNIKQNHTKDRTTQHQHHVTSSAHRVLPSDTSSTSGCSVTSISGRCAAPQPPVQFYLGGLTSPQSRVNSVSPSVAAASQRSSLSDHRASYCNPSLQTPSPCPQRAHLDSTLDSSAATHLCGRQSVTSFSNRSSSASGGATAMSHRAPSSCVFLDDANCEMSDVTTQPHSKSITTPPPPYTPLDPPLLL